MFAGRSYPRRRRYYRQTNAITDVDWFPFAASAADTS